MICLCRYVSIVLVIILSIKMKYLFLSLLLSHLHRQYNDATFVTTCVIRMHIIINSSPSYGSSMAIILHYFSIHLSVLKENTY